MKDSDYIKKREEIARTHPDRLLTKCAKISDVREFIKEAKSKNYTIFPHDELKNDYQGLVLFKEIDGVELAYNPKWKTGKLGITTEELLKEFNKEQT